MPFEHMRPDQEPWSPRRPPSFFDRNPGAGIALVVLVVALLAGLIAAGNWYAAQLEPCLHTDEGDLGNCRDATGPLVVGLALGIPSGSALAWLGLHDRARRRGES